MNRKRSYKDFMGAAVFVGAIALGVGAANADETHINLVMQPSTVSAPIAVPGLNGPTSVTCARSNQGDAGVGQATLQRLNPVGTLQWIGVSQAENQGTTAKIDQGFSVTQGTTIIFCDFGGVVVLEDFNGSQVQVHNKDSSVANVFLHFNY